MKSDRKKALQNAYKNRTVTGGICCVRCSGNNRIWLQATRDIESLQNRFNFAVATKSSPDPSMREEWKKYGIDTFSFSILEELKKGETQTDQEFAADIDLLYEMWLEKFPQSKRK